MVAQDSEQHGRELNDALDDAGDRSSPTSSTRISSIAQGEQQNVSAARALGPPGPLRLQHQEAIEALEFRVSGLRGLADGVRRRRAQSPKNVNSNAVNLLQPPAERLIASDVVWDDLFQAPAQGNGGVLQREGISGVAVPGSLFVAKADYASAAFWAPMLQRLQGSSTGGSTGGGLHGTGLV